MLILSQYILPTICYEPFYGSKHTLISNPAHLDRYTLLYLKWIINKDILYTQGTLLNVTCQPGLEEIWERMDTNILGAESLCCPPKTTTYINFLICALIELNSCLVDYMYVSL